MSEKVQNIAKNTSYFTIALVMQKVISFGYFTLLARYLGPEQLGQYFFAISFASIFGIFTDIGIANVLTREVAKNQSDSSSLISNIIAIKIPLTILTWILMIGSLFFLGYTGNLALLVLVSLICVTLDSFTYTFYAVSRGHHNLYYESLSSILFQLIVLFVGTFFLIFNFGLLFIMSALLSASLFNFLYSSILLKLKWKIRFFEKVDMVVVKNLLVLSLPFGIFAGFQRIYTYLDPVLLKIMDGDYHIGLYQIPFKIIFSLQFIPMAFTASLYPAMSTYWKQNKEQLLITFERAFSYLLIISMPISFGIAFLSEKVLVIFSSNFNDSLTPLIIIIFSLPFIFLNFPIGSLLNACDKQKLNTLNMGVALFASVLLNIILIPKYQSIGASITVLVTNAMMFLMGMAQIPKIIEIKFSRLILMIAKVVFASAIMGGFVFVLRDYFNIFVVVIISALIYFLMLYLVKGFRKEDIVSIINSFSKKN